MCRNHSHVRVAQIMGSVQPDGSIMTIAALEGEHVILENPRVGAKFEVPASTLLLLLSPGPETPSYSLEAWTVAFSALQYAMATVDPEPGEDMLMTLNRL